VLLVAGVLGVPLLQALFYSFTNWNGATASFVGLRNYANIFVDPDLRRSLVNSGLILASIPFGMVLAFVTAYLLNVGVTGSRPMRSAIFAPTALSWVVIGIVARQFFASNGGINALLQSVGLGLFAHNWLADPVTAMIAVLVTFNAAVFGINTIIFLTALSTIDKSTIEAARIDGASELTILFAIVFPAVKRFIEFVFIITMVVSFTGLFGLIYVITGGGPGLATMTLEFAVWKRALSTGAFGSGAAIGVALMALVLFMIFLTRRIGLGRDDQ
jgi:multiple sugar transport system permease protein